MDAFFGQMSSREFVNWQAIYELEAEELEEREHELTARMQTETVG